jgi:small GTP-binding protein
MKRGAPTKVTFIGESSVGKSSIVLRLGKNKFDDAIGTTIGGAFCTVKYPRGISEEPITFHFWDCAGQTRYNALVPMYLRGSAVIVLVYDISSRETFERIGLHWIPFVRQTLVVPEGSAEPMLLIVGNKSDRASHRDVSTIEAQTFAANNGLSFCEVSAKTGDNVKEIMKILSDHVEMTASAASTASADTLKIEESTAGNSWMTGLQRCSGCGF